MGQFLAGTYESCYAFRPFKNCGVSIFFKGYLQTFLDGFSIGRYKQKCESFDLIDAKFKGKVMQFSKGKLLWRWSPFKTRIPPLSFYY